MALGAARSRVIGTVMRGAILQAVTGLAIRHPGGNLLCTVRQVAALWRSPAWNVPVMIVAIGMLVLAAAIASIIPTRRAASIDPVQALRD